MPAHILQITPLPGTDPGAFEKNLLGTIIPGIHILHRTVQANSCRVFRAESDGTQPASYIVLVFVQLVGATPETAGEGPTTLCALDLPTEKLAKELAGQATVRLLGEI